MNGPTFSEKVKEELSNLPVMENVYEELLGFMKARGNYDIRKKRFTINLGNIPAARRFIHIVETLSGKKLEEMQIGVRKLDERKRINLTLPKDSLDLDWKSYFDDKKIIKVVGNDPVVFGAFLRGFFLAAGSISNPRRHYHFELVTFDSSMLNLMRDRIHFILGIKGNVVKLRYNYRLYYKCSKCILELLYLMGAERSAIEYERVMSEKAAKGDTNRTMNFITANSNRSGSSIVKQIMAIKKIEETIGLNSLSEDLRRVAKARLENEDLSLRELGEILNMSKMMVYNRLKKILKIAEELK